ncbi:Aste57867_23286 [Aphanomyces stellatus]|uniref:Aste57867_23286 protein n=1 Tax=Aphanomyces stellatus TaxID=120398 RepID=A0A485LND1_9STRA|nr:hypothetical protein As57867_023215 [Aphanomyces stellatus]VFT99931.1 Aste57867_23286 [Aphanomyces stellatus]
MCVQLGCPESHATSLDVEAESHVMRWRAHDGGANSTRYKYLVTPPSARLYISTDGAAAPIMTHTRKRRYVGTANVKRRQEVEGSNNALPRRFNDMNFLPSPEKPTKEPPPPSVEQEQQHQPTPPPAKKPAKDVLAEHIHAHQRDTKNYKLEPWYKSPAGIGSVSNTIAAALSASDKNQSGYVSCDDVISTLQQMNFGLKEHEVRELLTSHDPSFTTGALGTVHYRSFAKQFDVPRDPEQDKIEDPLTRQERYIAALQQRVASQVPPVPSAVGRRRHRKNEINTTKLDTIETARVPTPPEKPKGGGATTRLPPVAGNGRHVLERTEHPPAVLDVADESSSHCFSMEDFGSDLRAKLPSPTRYSAKNAPGVIPHTMTTLVLGGDMRNTPNSLKRAKLMPQVVDQRHREATRQAKRHIISDHLERIQAYAAQTDYDVQRAADNHVKATSTKMLHYHQAFFDTQSQGAAKAQHKGLIHSDVAKHNHNASKESMFFPG